jgi:sugar/nucleoside kinase (ribokinase family)
MEMLEVCLDADIVLINFISGFDVKLETAKRFRSIFSKLLFMDVHSMTLGMDDEGVRFKRNVVEWRVWSGLADIIQMNLREATLFTGLQGTRDRLAAYICEAGPDVCLITLGSAGVFFAERKEVGLVMKTVEVLPSEARDPTGCGDVFSAGFISSFARNRDVYDACVAGNRAAAACCESSGIETLGEVLSR